MTDDLFSPALNPCRECGEVPLLAPWFEHWIVCRVCEHPLTPTEYHATAEEAAAKWNAENPIPHETGL
jgi:hypothetical protein